MRLNNENKKHGFSFCIVFGFHYICSNSGKAIMKIDASVPKFLLVGVLNTLFGTAIMFVLYNVFHVSYWWSSAANYFFGSILSYVLNKRFTFKHKGHVVSSALRFTLSIIICYVIAYSIAKPLMMWMLSGYGKAVQENVAMVVGTVLFTILNYFGQRFFAFDERHKS